MKIFLQVLIMLSLATYAAGQDVVLDSYVESGMGAFKRGDYATAERYFNSAVKEISSNGKADKKTLDRMVAVLNMLSNAYQAQGKFVNAEAINRKILEIVELTREESDPGLSIVLNNLGLSLTEQRKYAEAEKMQRRALILREKYLEAGDVNIAISLNNLAKVFHDQGKNEEAFPLYVRAFQIVTDTPKENMASEHFELAIDLSGNLGLIFTGKGEHEAAEKMFTLAIQMIERIKGNDHPDLIPRLRNYAKLLRAAKRNAEAGKMEARAAAIEKVSR